MTIDPGYNVGFTFARQYGIRVTKDFDHKVAIAVAVENAQATLSTHGNTDNFLLGEAGATNSYNDAVTGCAIAPILRLAHHPCLLRTCYACRHLFLQPVARYRRQGGIRSGFWTLRGLRIV